MIRNDIKKRNNDISYNRLGLDDNENIFHDYSKQTNNDNDDNKIYISNGKKYIMCGKKLVQACIITNCIKRREGGKFGDYCYTHYNSLDNEFKIKLISKSLQHKIHNKYSNTDNYYNEDISAIDDQHTDNNIDDVYDINNDMDDDIDDIDNIDNNMNDEIDDDIDNDIDNDMDDDIDDDMDNDIDIDSDIDNDIDNDSDELDEVNENNNIHGTKNKIKSETDRNVVIDGITIYYKNGIPHIKRMGKLVLSCIIDNCPKRKEGGEKGNYCNSHYNSLNNESKLKLFNEYILRKNEKQIKKNNKIKKKKPELKITNFSNGSQIIIKNNKKYIKTTAGNIILGCIEESCVKGKSRKIKNSDYCAYHYRLLINKLDEKDDIDIIIDNNIKYRKGNDNYLHKVCMYENCKNYSRGIKFGNYCMKHYESLETNSKNQLICEYNEKKDSNKLIIIKNGKRYIKINEKKDLIRLCNIDNCPYYGKNKGGFCDNHKQHNISKTELLDKILIKNGKKYIRNNDKFILGCLIDDCTNSLSISNNHYCTEHLAEQKICNSDLIIYENNIKFVKTNSNNIKLGCITECCSRIALKNQYGNYCAQHFNYVDKEERQLIIDKFNTKSEKSKNWEIIIKNDKKYKDIDGKLIPLCKYENCKHVKHSKYIGDYCDIHSIELGIDKEKNGDIIIKNNKKYIRYDGKLYLSCIINNCNEIGTYGEYCYYCFKTLTLNEINNLVENYKQAACKNKNRDNDKFYTDGNTKYKFMDGYRNMKALCIFENCISGMCRGKCKYFCQLHHKLISLEEKTILMSEYETNKKSKIINNSRIYFIENDKLKKDDMNNFVKVCLYDNCSNESTRENNYIYCDRHKNGIDNNLSKMELENAIKKIIQKQNGVNATKIGDETEKWVEEKIKTFNNIQSVERIGYMRHTLDIIYKINNNYRGIQVKTLSHTTRKHDDHFSISECKYDNDVLMVCVNKDRNKFALFFYGDIEKLEFDYRNKNSKNYKFMYTDLNKFLKDLMYKLENSKIFDKYDIKNLAVKQEIESMDRLKSKCKEHNLNFEFYDTHISPIDCIINSKNIQCKSTSAKSSNSSYVVQLCKRNIGKIVPYSDNDKIDFFIFEVITFEYNFYIVPINILIEKGYIHTNIKKGKTQLIIPINQDNKNNWIDIYKNNFNLLK